MKYRVALSLIAGCALLAASFSSFATLSFIFHTYTSFRTRSGTQLTGPNSSLRRLYLDSER